MKLVKRKEAIIDKNAVNGGWTGEQEISLQKAYFGTKPTPRFWKEVAKLVPGKCAQECFDKVHSQYLTPPQARGRATLRKAETFMLSPSELLKPSKSNRRVRKTSVTRSRMQKLLQKNCQVPLDLFSVLEPTKNAPVENNAAAFSTPGTDRSRPASRFSRSPFASPPVLKPVKNRALHDKYIARLSFREARRKIEAAKSSARDRREAGSAGKSDAVTAAKMALASDAQDAIKRFQREQAVADRESSKLELDDDGFDDDVEDEDCEL